MSTKKIRAGQRHPMILAQATRTAAVQAEHDAMILAILADGAERNYKEIARSLPFGLQRVQRRIGVLLEQKKVHQSRRNSSGKFYRIGAVGPVTPSVAERILGVLAEGPATAQQIADKLGLGRPHIADTIKTVLMREGAKKIHVRQWLKTGPNKKQRTILYAIGNRPDAQRPAPQSQAVICRRNRARRKADAQADAELFIVDRARKVARTIKPKADPFMSQFAGLFGERQAA